MRHVCVTGIGAVSPAGWTVSALRDALAKGEPLPTAALARPGAAHPFRVRPVPKPLVRPDFLAHSRLRRTSPIAQFVTSAALEALGPDIAAVRAGKLRLGIVACVMAGPVNYSRRFYEEALRDPATASPMVFPETVFNAPASHVAALLGSTGISYTLVGDPGMFLSGLALAADWIIQDRVDAALVVSGEELDWIVADAARRFQRNAISAEGAGAVYLRGAPATSAIQLAAVTDAHTYGSGRTRLAAAQAMRADLPRSRLDHLLADGLTGLLRADTAEAQAWADWIGLRLSPKRILGEGFAAGSSWQCVAAIDALMQGSAAAASVSVVGCNQQAIGAHFVKDAG